LAITALFLGSFATFADLYCVQPLLPQFSQQFHVPPAVGSLALALFLLITPALADWAGHKPVMTVSLVLTGVLCTLTALAPTFPQLLALRFGQGIFLAGFPSIAMAYIGAAFSPGRLGRVMGIYVGEPASAGWPGAFLWAPSRISFPGAWLWLFWAGCVFCSVSCSGLCYRRVPVFAA